MRGGVEGAQEKVMIAWRQNPDPADARPGVRSAFGDRQRYHRIAATDQGMGSGLLGRLGACGHGG
jgi:hypothetical protein